MTPSGIRAWTWQAAGAWEFFSFSCPRSAITAALWEFFEVLSTSPGAFDERDVATMQLLSGMMVAAISRISSLKQAELLQRAG